MSILSALKETRHENNNLDDLAKLPQALIMQMAQRGEIQKDMVMPILGKKAEMVEEAAKMKAAQTLAAQGGVQPTVMEQYMGKIAQAENPAPAMPQQQMPQQIAQAPMPQGMENAGVAQLPIPERNYAGGGIIAFSGEDNSYVDPEEETYRKMVEDAREEAEDADIYDMIANLKGSGTGENKNIKQDTRERANKQITDEDQARRYNVGNLRPSGFSYPGQVGTSKGGFAMFDNPEAGIAALHHDIGIKLNRGLDTPTKFISVYAPAGDKNDVKAYSKNVAGMLGIGANDKIPNTPEARQLLANAIVRQEGAHKATAAFAYGGEVRHFASDGYVGFGSEAPYDPNEPSIYDTFGSMIGSPLERLKSSIYGVGPTTAKERKQALEDKKNKTTPAKTAAAPTQAPAPAPRTDIPQSPEGIKNLQAQAKEEGFDFMNYIKNREAKMEKAAEQDKWLAGLSAGLGMLGGTSPYAMANIGQGGQMGIQQMAASQRGRAAQEASLGTLYGAAAKSDLMNKLRRDQLAQGKELSEDKLNQNLLTAKNTFIEKRLKAKGMDEMMLGTLRRQKAMGKLDPSKEAELNYYEKQMQDIENEANRMYTSPGAGMKIVGVR